MKNKILYCMPWILLTVFALLFVFRECSPNPPVIPDSSELKSQIQANLKERDTVLIEVKTSDSVRTKYITKWKTVRRDSLIPCEEKVLVCDTVILQDSVLISDLKALVQLDSAIISDQGKLIQKDSIDILALKKEVKKQKRQKRLVVALSVILGVIAVGR